MAEGQGSGSRVTDREGLEDALRRDLEALRAEVRSLRERVAGLGGAPPVPEGRVRTHVEGFDAALGGGIPAGHVVLVVGPTGTMKTSLALGLLHGNARLGVRGLYVSLEESRESLLRTMEALGMTPDGDFIVDIARLRTEHEATEEARDWVRILRDYLRRRVERDGVQLVVVDSLNALYALAELERPRRPLFHLFNLLRDLGVTGVFVVESEAANAPVGRGEDYLADGVLQLRYADGPAGKVEVWLRCLKMRHTAHERGDFRLEPRAGRFVARPVADQ